MLVRELSLRLDVPFEGDGDVRITGAAPLDEAGPQQITFIGSRKAFGAAQRSGAGCLVAPLDFESAAGRTLLRAAQPRAVFAAAIQLLYPPPPVRPGVHRTAAVAADAEIDASAEIGAHVTIEAQAHIGPGCRIGSGCFIGARSSLGAGSTLYPA